MMWRFIYQRLLPHYAVGALPPMLRRRIADALSTDEVLAQEYDALRRAERLSQGAAPLSRAQEESLLADILAATPATVTDQSMTNPAPAMRRPAWQFGAVGALAAGVALLAVQMPTTTTDPSEVNTVVGTLTARSAAMANEPLGVRVRCVVGDVVRDEAVGGARQTGADLDCGRGDLLAFSMTNQSRGDRYAFVIGVAADGSRVWLPPFVQSSSSVVTAAGSVDVLLDTLAPVTHAQDVTLFVLLSDQPFSGSAIAQRLDQAERAGMPLAKMDKLPLDAPVQSRVLLRHRP